MVITNPEQIGGEQTLFHSQHELDPTSHTAELWACNIKEMKRLNPYNARIKSVNGKYMEDLYGKTNLTALNTLSRISGSVQPIHVVSLLKNFRRVWCQKNKQWLLQRRQLQPLLANTALAFPCCEREAKTTLPLIFQFLEP